MKDISVCIVDDSMELRDALREVINLAEGFLCVGTIASAEEAVIELPRLRPDVVLMDINLGEGKNGIECVRALKPYLKSSNFMMCTVYEESEKIFEALRVGANGYILKKTEPQKLLEAIRELHEGGAPMSTQIAKKVVSAFHLIKPRDGAHLDVLSPREKEILELLAEGLMYKEIAARIFLSPETVRKHVYHVYEKLHVNNRVSAVNKFFGR
jgi:DNA-binding NarL/FixJ family response regulator